MNERIKLLAEQAMSATFNKFSGVEWSAEEWRNFYDTKFAELIVRECVLICGAIQGAGDLRNMPDFASGAAQCKAIIKRDFGVEE